MTTKPKQYVALFPWPTGATVKDAILAWAMEIIDEGDQDMEEYLRSVGKA